MCFVSLFAAACGETAWNNPYPGDDSGKSIFYSSFVERPKHLDPVSSYSENEAQFNAQIYEPVVQYHFLKRPYELIPLTATSVPKPTYYDAAGNELGPDATSERVAKVVYRISIQTGIEYQPHPAFAQREDGSFVYQSLSLQALDDKNVLADFPATGSRELIAEDYVYQIKRLAHPRLHSPIAGFMAKYIKDLDKLAATLKAAEQALPGQEVFLDLRQHDFAGARVIDRYTYEIELTEKYPQFVYWLAMSFFAPIPWEADAFYSQPGMKERNLTLDWYPVGTGPYMLTENNPNRRMVLAKNPNFRGEQYPTEGMPSDEYRGWLDDAGKQIPFIDAGDFHA